MRKYDVVKIIIQEKGLVDDDFKASLEKQLNNKLDNKFKLIKFMKNIAIITLSILILVGGGYITYRLIEKDKNSEIVETNTEDNTDSIGNVGIANPASVNCEEKGGIVEMRDEAEGQVGYCYFEDGSFCEEWAFMRGECKQGDQK